ncbi:MAG: glycosyltransferase, partial [Saprospiraceae bacterium]|nr:glycosyltransferase [Saprospiraceae bacterium]
MTYYLLFAAIVSLGYCLLQIVLVIFWSRIPVPYDQPQRTPSVSIVVAFRDEADHLQALMNALVRQDYPRNKYEVILVDNHSKDDGLNIVRCYAEKHAN